eukprot:scaffold60947_cov48-Phaeocystis_antarctica.AAC.2
MCERAGGPIPSLLLKIEVSPFTPNSARRAPPTAQSLGEHAGAPSWPRLVPPLGRALSLHAHYAPYAPYAHYQRAHPGPHRRASDQRALFGLRCGQAERGRLWRCGRSDEREEEAGGQGGCLRREHAAPHQAAEVHHERVPRDAAGVAGQAGGWHVVPQQGAAEARHDARRLDRDDDRRAGGQGPDADRHHQPDDAVRGRPAGPHRLPGARADHAGARARERQADHRGYARAAGDDGHAAAVDHP